MLSSESKFISKGQHALIGKALEKENPDLYLRLKTTYVDQQPVHTEIATVTLMYQRFCQANDIKDGKCQIDSRRLFIAAILKLYSPKIFSQPIKYRIPRRGLRNKLSATLGVHKRTITYLVGQIIEWYRSYDEFKIGVDETVTQISAIENA